ncbi:MAG: hypothetical protein LBJ82_01840 [Deltaproteobacteria bacterium]|nr:hypothetical protein [Deltaproteobacteria bacterium]
MPFPEIHVLAALPWEELSWRTVAPLLFFLSLLTAAGAQLTAALAEAAAGRKAFGQKYALQVSQLAFWAAIPFCCLAPFFAPPTGDPGTPAGLILEISRRLPPVFWIIPALIHRFSWAALRKHPSAHLCLGLLSIPCALALLALPACLALQSFSPCLAEAAGESRAVLAFFLPVLTHCLALALAAAASFCLPWLLLRRAAMDYGRDYYAFALRAAAGQALAATLAALATGAVLLAAHFPPCGSLVPYPIPAAAAGGLSLICLILWGLILKSPSPLRHKLSALLACLLFPAAAHAQFSALWRALTAP